MLVGKVWKMDFEDKQKKVLTVDEGALEIGRMCGYWTQTLYDENGNGVGVEDVYGEFEELIVPSSVIKINDFAFANLSALRKISILENVTIIGKKAFKGCDALAYVTAPKISLKSVADTDVKLKLAMGYLLNKELYSDDIAQEYEQYVKKQKKKLPPIEQKLEINANQLFYGALVRGPKEIVDKFIEEQMKEAQIYEQKKIGSNETLLRFNCCGYQVDCQSKNYKDLAIVIFTTLGNSAYLFVKKIGEIMLKEYSIGEADSNSERLQIYSACPDKVIHEKYVMSDYGEGIEFKYNPSEYVLSMSSDDIINKNADDKPVVYCECLEEPDEELYVEGYVRLV